VFARGGYDMADPIPIWRWLMFANGKNDSQVDDVSQGFS